MDTMYTHVRALYIYPCVQLVTDIADHLGGGTFLFGISQVNLVYLGSVHCMIYPFEDSVESMKNCVSLLQGVPFWTDSTK